MGKDQPTRAKTRRVTSSPSTDEGKEGPVTKAAAVASSKSGLPLRAMREPEG